MSAADGAYLARVFSGAVLIHMVIGAFFSWGNLTIYVTSYLRAYADPRLGYEDTSWVLSAAGALLGFVAYFGGALHETLGLRGTSVLGGAILCVGVALSSLTIQHSYSAFFFSYTILFGVGIGIAYSAPVKCAMLAMPGRAGTASGLVMCGMGLGSFVFTVFQTYLVNPQNRRPDATISSTGDAIFTEPAVLERVPQMFLTLAFIYAVLIALGGALMVEKPPKDPASADEARQSTALDSGQAEGQEGEVSAAIVVARDWTPQELLYSREFWIILGCYFLNMQAVMVFTGYLKVLGLGLLPKASDWQLSMATAVSAWCNGVGRPGWGYVCDVLTFRVGMIALSAATAVFTGTVGLCAYGGFVMYLLWMCFIFLCVGGICSIYAGATSAYFGTRHFGRNFGLMTTGAGLAWLTGAGLLGLLRGRISDAGVCLVTAGCSVAAMLCGLALPELSEFKRRHSDPA